MVLSAMLVALSALGAVDAADAGTALVGKYVSTCKYLKDDCTGVQNPASLFATKKALAKDATDGCKTSVIATITTHHAALCYEDNGKTKCKEGTSVLGCADAITTAKAAGDVVVGECKKTAAGSEKLVEGVCSGGDGSGEPGSALVGTTTRTCKYASVDCSGVPAAETTREGQAKDATTGCAKTGTMHQSLKCYEEGGKKICAEATSSTSCEDAVKKTDVFSISNVLGQCQGLLTAGSQKLVDGACPSTINTSSAFSHVHGGFALVFLMVIPICINL